MTISRRTLTTTLALTALVGVSTMVHAKRKPIHNNGRKLLGEKLKKDGKHVVEKKGPHTVSFEVKDGKVAGMHVKHATKGELPVKKYKSKKNMVAKAADSGFITVAYVQVQDQYLGTTYIGYSYYDDFGDETVYWFPYDMILDGDTGAVEYVAAY